MARKIGDALADEDVFARVLRIGGETADVLGREFADKVKQFQGQQYFKGERVAGQPELRRGLGISIEEESIRGMNISKAIKENLKAQAEFIKLETKDLKIIRPDKVEIIGMPAEGMVGAKNLLTNEDMNRQLNIENNARRYKSGIITEANIPPAENKIEINFSEGSFVIKGGTPEEQKKAMDSAFISMGTPGTPYNQQLVKGMFGNKQIKVV